LLLERILGRAHDGERMAPIARKMLEAGAVKSETMRRFVKQLGEKL